MQNTALLEDKKTGIGIGIVALLVIVGLALSRRGGLKTGKDSVEGGGGLASEARELVMMTMTGETGSFASEAEKNRYEVLANRGVELLEHPETPAGFLATAIAESLNDRGKIIEAANIAERVAATASGAVSFVNPVEADKLIEMGAEAVYYSTQSGEYVNIYKNGQLVAKIDSPDYVEKIAARQASAQAATEANLAMQASIADAIAAYYSSPQSYQASQAANQAIDHLISSGVAPAGYTEAIVWRAMGGSF
jgi:hypothetical protein